MGARPAIVNKGKPCAQKEEASEHQCSEAHQRFCSSRVNGWPVFETGCWIRWTTGLSSRAPVIIYLFISLLFFPRTLLH